MEQKQRNTPSHFAKWSLIVGIVIVLNMFFNYSISLVYKEPQYPVTQTSVVRDFQTKDDCLAVGGQWTEGSLSIAPNGNSELVGNGKVIENGNTVSIYQNSGSCDPDYTNRQTYEAAHKVYQRNVFVILMILGIISLMIGVFVTQDVLAAALSWGGVLSLLIASMRYWSDADNLVKVLLLALALGGLIWTAVRKFGRA